MQIYRSNRHRYRYSVMNPIISTVYLYKFFRHTDILKFPIYQNFAVYLGNAEIFDIPKSPILLHYNHRNNRQCFYNRSNISMTTIQKKSVLKFKRHVASNTKHLYLLPTLFLNLSIGTCLDAKTVIFTIQIKIKQNDDSIYLKFQKLVLFSSHIGFQES